MPDSFKNLKRGPASEILAGLTSDNADTYMSASKRLHMAQKDAGLSLREYLTAAVVITEEQHKKGIRTGYEAALEYLNLPVRNDFVGGVSIQAAQDTFATQPGTRIMFPEVVMDSITWKQGPQNRLLSVEPLIAQSRTVTGTNQLVYFQLDEDGQDLGMNRIAEAAKIPVVDITYADVSVKFYKVGKGYRMSYEFDRRANIDILTPFVNRMLREFELQRVKHATNILVNGDNVAGAMTVDAETAHGGTNGVLDYKSFLKWIVSRMAASYPIDTLPMNYNSYAEFMSLFEPNTGTASNMEAVGGRMGVSISGNPLEQLNLTPVLAPEMPDSVIGGLIKSETLEELVEAGSEITESQRLIDSQQVEFFRTMNIGYNLVTPDARRGFSFAS